MRRCDAKCGVLLMLMLGTPFEHASHGFDGK
jgi:hypothetical protein